MKNQKGHQYHSFLTSTKLLKVQQRQLKGLEERLLLEWESYSALENNSKREHEVNNAWSELVLQLETITQHILSLQSKVHASFSSLAHRSEAYETSNTPSPVPQHPTKSPYNQKHPPTAHHPDTLARNTSSRSRETSMSPSPWEQGSVNTPINHKQSVFAEHAKNFPNVLQATPEQKRLAMQLLERIQSKENREIKKVLEGIKGRHIRTFYQIYSAPLGEHGEDEQELRYFLVEFGINQDRRLGWLIPSLLRGTQGIAGSCFELRGDSLEKFATLEYSSETLKTHCRESTEDLKVSFLQQAKVIEKGVLR